MSALREPTTGATTASTFFSSAIGTPNLPIRGGAAANTINRCNSAGGKTRHAARKPHGRSGSDSALQWLLLVRSAFGFLEIFWGTLGLRGSIMAKRLGRPSAAERKV